MKPAVDKVKQDPRLMKNLNKIGIVANQTSTTSNFECSVDIIYEACKLTTNAKVTCVFGPQHGYRQTEQDNMKETSDDFYTFSDGKKVPLFSLYSNTREPKEQHLQNVDTLVVDMQDIGCRIYTYMLTLAACMRAAHKYNKKIIVLDRVNPLGLAKKLNKNYWKYVEGNKLEHKWHSFVGWYDIPIRHGLSMGELGYYFINHDKLKIEYNVIPVNNLKRGFQTKSLKNIPWAMPSPNIPSWESAFFFPAFVALEGTNVSEGRGTTIPFQLIGAPWLNAKKCIEFLKSKQIVYNPKKTKSLTMREHHFRPTFNKFVDQICKGIQFHALEPENIKIFSLGMHFLEFCLQEHPKDFKWSNPGYEYNYTDLPINLILGNDLWYTHFETIRVKSNEHKIDSLLKQYKSDEMSFMNQFEPYLIYKE